MNDFLQFYSLVCEAYPMHLVIGQCKICDWYIHIYKKGCGENGSDLEIFYEQSCDAPYLFAKAQVALKDFLVKQNGGY